MSLKLDIALEPDSRLTGKAVLICFLSSSLILLNVFAVMEIGRKRCCCRRVNVLVACLAMNM